MIIGEPVTEGLDQKRRSNFAIIFSLQESAEKETAMNAIQES